MNAMTEREFKKMPFLKRLNSLKSNGEFVASRTFVGYEIHLCIYEKLYIEVWTYIGLQHVLWIEPLRNSEAWKEYLDRIQLPEDPTQ